MLRFIIRPRGIRGTPSRLALALNAVTRRYPGYDGVCRFNECFFFRYPQEIENAPPEISNVRHFFSLNKAEQRRCLSTGEYGQPHRGCPTDASGRSFCGDTSASPGSGASLNPCASLPVPDTYTQRVCVRASQLGHRDDQSRTNGSPQPHEGDGTSVVGDGTYVVRPYRHHGGENYRITTDPEDFQEGSEYISRIFEKDREYRIIYVLGTPLVVLKKKVPEGLSNQLHWNFANGSTFVTVPMAESVLRRTDIFRRLETNPIIQYADIVGVDVLYKNTGEYVIVEFNSAPGINIPANLESIATHVRAHHRFQ
jgi:hypothetical protein